MGAAWQWQGEGGAGFDSSVVQSMQRFLSSSQPRIRTLGGVRFDPQQQPAAEWERFGAYCFLLPQLEFLEAAECCLLACTVAWDRAAPAAASAATASAAGSTELAGAAGEAAELGQDLEPVACADARSAVERALLTLQQLQPPAPEAAAAVSVRRLSERQSPDEQQWGQAVGQLLGVLEDAPQPVHQPGTTLVNLDLDLAREEYQQNGQQVSGRAAGCWMLAQQVCGKCVCLAIWPGLQAAGCRRVSLRSASMILHCASADAS
jgi:isochorismate synthase/2-succinyl-5-enolpyruvyl-6-hydroxy-3-cyclohexene-1-carboxylate synthase/2-succinyl-6-hydroxy-2,4-cyclohexadiene-1-carboxylate synthase/O-succinylbenzoate synthase